MIAEIKLAWEEIGADGSVRAVLLTGSGRGFCAGADLADPDRKNDADSGSALDKFFNPVIRTMRALPKPIVAAVNGVAAGVGMSFAMAADIAIAAKSASFLQAFSRIGLLPDGGSTWFLPRLVGEQRARALAMLAPQIPAEQAKRYYTRSAMVRDPGTGACSRVTVGLVGLHIVQKTVSRPQWIWSSYEQIDSVPPSRFGDPVKFTFHDGGKARMPDENPLSLTPLAAQPVAPFNVERPFFAKVHPKTELTNYQYQELLKDTVWQYYGIVTTQWPRMEGNQALPVPATQNGDITNTFPGAGAFSAYANVAMETFDQGRPQLGCMSCHNQARLSADFMWSVVDHAYPAKIAPSAKAAGNKTTQ